MSTGGSDADFRIFILSMLKLANINEEYREQFTDKEGMELFRRAFTHESFDPVNNYETLEFIGDGIMKGILCQYLPRRFPYGSFPLVSTYHGIISKQSRYLEQSKRLGEMAVGLGFWKYIRITDEEQYKYNRNKICEDLLEAFVGALVEIVDTRIHQGLGYNYAYNFFTPNLDKLNIPTSRDLLDDSITNINELYTGKLRGNVQFLNWGPANYEEKAYLMPNVRTLPDKANIGDLLYWNTSRAVMIYTRNGWIPFNQTVVTDAFNKPPQLVPGGKRPEDNTNTIVFYTVLYGFPKPSQMLNGRPVKEILGEDRQKKHIRPMNEYGAIPIGRGMSHDKQKAKHEAAKEGVEWLNNQGYYRSEEPK